MVVSLRYGGIFILVVLIGAVAVFLPRLLTGEPATAGPLETEPPAVAWIDAPESPPFTSLIVPTATQGVSPACELAHLSVDFRLNQGAGGNLVYNLSITNASDTICSVPSSPPIIVTTPDGQPFTASTGATTALSLPPGVRAFSIVTVPTLSRCLGSNGLNGSQPGPAAHDVFVKLPSGTVHIDMLARHESIYPYCGINAMELRLEDASLPPWPVEKLQASIVAPTSVKAGSTLSYFVDLANPTSADIELSPCPVYQEWLQQAIAPTAAPISSPTALPFQAAKLATARAEGAKQAGPSAETLKVSYALNCAAMNVVPAGASVRFEMRLSVPANFPSGEAQLAWSLMRVAVKFPPVTVIVLP